MVADVFVYSLVLRLRLPRKMHGAPTKDPQKHPKRPPPPQGHTKDTPRILPVPLKRTRGPCRE